MVSLRRIGLTPLAPPLFLQQSKSAISLSLIIFTKNQCDVILVEIYAVYILILNGGFRNPWKPPPYAPDTHGILMII